MNNYGLIAILALALLLAGCESGPQGPDMGTPFIGGNAAMNMYLMNGLPPPTIYDGGTQPFAMGVVLENVGEVDIGPGTDNPFLQIRLEGFLPSIFGITDADLIKTPGVQIRGAKKNFDGTMLPGEVYNELFQPLNYMPETWGNTELIYSIVACYDYTNYATTMLCMKDSVLENVQDSDICTLTGEKMVHNSGGPIHITKSWQNPMDANKIQVNFEVSHVGSGEFYGRESGETCSVLVTNSNKFKIHMKVSTFDTNANIVCYRLGGGSEGDLTMYQGSSQMVTCIIEGSQSAARIYQEVVNIEMTYRYGEFIRDTLIVQAVPR